LQFCKRFGIGCKLLLAVRRKLIHQVIVLAGINAAAFALAYAKLKVGFQRYPFVAERNLIDKVGFQLIAKLTGEEAAAVKAGFWARVRFSRSE